MPRLASVATTTSSAPLSYRITFSDSEGWRFYLPAYMAHCLRRFPDCGWDAVLDACFNKTHVELLTKEQLRCVDRFVELCERHGQFPWKS